MKKIIVINNPREFVLDLPDVEVISPKVYLGQSAYHRLKNVRVFNLCNDYSYQSRGYYVSLLAEARGHKPVPSVKSIQDLKAPSIVRIVSDDLADLIQTSLRKLKSDEFALSVYFGRNVSKQYDKLAHEFYRLFPAPFMRARFARDPETGGWTVQSLRSMTWKEIPDNHLSYVRSFAEEYFRKKRFESARVQQYDYDLAILASPHEKAAPSDKKALAKFEEAANRAGCYVEFITRDDYQRIAEFDALFIRETTSVNHHTYRMARRAQSEGIAVIDDPDSILRCTNKVYLAELLALNKIPTPRTLILQSSDHREVLKVLGLPCVLKLPDSSFSQGVVKAKTEAQLKEELKTMLQTSDLVLAQEYMPTDFDWRIGVLDGAPLFACKYYMAKDHWQIYNWSSAEKDDVMGNFDSLPIEQVPPFVLDTAIKATNLIGKGLYGVDMKEKDGVGYVIEINDNPSIDADVEDQVLGDALYDRIIRSLIRRIEEGR